MVSLKMVSYWSVTRKGIREISCGREQEVELVLYLLEAVEHLAEWQSLCSLPYQLLGQEMGRQKGLQRAVTTSKGRVPPCVPFPPGWQWVALGNDSFGIPWLCQPLSLPEPWRVHHSEKRPEESSAQPQSRLSLVPRENKGGKLTSCPRKWVFCLHHCGGKIQFYQCH